MNSREVAAELRWIANLMDPPTASAIDPDGGLTMRDGESIGVTRDGPVADQVREYLRHGDDDSDDDMLARLAADMLANSELPGVDMASTFGGRP